MHVSSTARKGAQGTDNPLSPSGSEQNTLFLKLVLGISKQLPQVCDVGTSNNAAACYAHRGTGQICAIDKKVYILATAHLFDKEPSEYLLVAKMADKITPMFPFKYALPHESGPDIAYVPIGELDPATQGLILHPTSSFKGIYHLHHKPN